MLERLSKQIVCDLETVRELVDDFESEVNSQSGIIEILDKLIDKYNRGIK